MAGLLQAWEAAVRAVGANERATGRQLVMCNFPTASAALKPSAAKTDLHDVGEASFVVREALK